MRKLRHIIILMLALASLNSCEYEFDVKSKAAPGLYLQCIANPNYNEVNVELKYAAPAQGNTGDIPELKDIRIDLEVGDVTSSFATGSRSFVVPDQLVEGQKVGIRAQAAGLPSIESSCFIPRDVHIDSLSHAVDSVMNIKIDIFTVHLKEQPEEGQYLAFKLERQSWKTESMCVNEVFTPVSGSATDVEIEIARISLFRSMLIDETEDHGDLVTVVPASAIKNKQYTLPLPDYDSIWPEDPEKEEEKEEYIRIDYKISVFAVDENFYRYSLARYRSRSDFMAMMGLAPANFAWSNVKGGFGVCGAVSRTDSKTIE